MFATYYGEIAALVTAVFWTITALAFEVATKRVGTYSVNLIRLVFAFVFLALLTRITRGHFLPVDATAHAWVWLSVSGVIGFVLGDLFLFASYPIISSRVAMLIMTLVPPITAVLGWMLLDEVMGIKHMLGMLLVVGGIALTIWTRQEGERKMKLNYPLKGLFYAFLGALGQAGGLILSKFGMGSYDAFASTQIRIISGLAGFLVLVTLLGKWGNVARTFSDKQAMKGISVGSFFGPFLGVSFSLIAVQHAVAGAASTLMSIVPVLILFPAYFIFKQKISRRDIVGTLVSFGGVVLFFI